MRKKYKPFIIIVTFKDCKRAPHTLLIKVKQIYTLGRKDNNNTDSYWLSVPQVISDRDSDIITNCYPHLTQPR